MNTIHVDEESIFQIARQIESVELRSEYLSQVCGNDSTLLSRVESLLRVHEKDREYLRSPVARFDMTAAVPTASIKAGSQIGCYKLREQIGDGGMGVVFVAEQTEPVRRKVALKIIKSGMATQETLSRFEAERQALAMMDHPNIARVFDGGETETGQPYFVMELVQGEPITEYCDQRHLAIPDRLRLFQQVCRAVQHAHQKGIVHRDIKPSNVLVAVIDDQPVPKVIDFGVAKAVNQKLTDQTVYTQFTQLIGTPLYMSPEQVEMGVTDVDTRSDVYSLGVLLYELLTGNTPFDGETLRKASFDEMRRMIRVDEPLRPSAKVRTLQFDMLSTISQQRGRDPRHLRACLMGELDSIVMRTLEKDRNRRYDSASALAEDIERYLNDEPVEARPASTLYRIAKFARRHRGLVVSTTAVFTALGIGLILATAGYMTAEQRLEEVTRERENSQLLAEILMEMYPATWGAPSMGRQQTVYDSVSELSTSLGDRLRDHPVVEIQVRQIFASIFTKADETEKAREQLDIALELAQRQYGPNHLIVGEIYAGLADLAGTQFGPSDPEASLSHAEQAISIYESHGQTGPIVAWFAKQRCLAYWPERLDEAEAACREYVRLARAQSSGEPVIPRWDLGLFLMYHGRHEEAQVELEQALEICRSDDDRQPTLTGTVLSGLGKNYRRQQNITAAREAFLEAWTLYKDSGLQNELRGVFIGLELAEVYFAAGEIDLAFRQAQAMEDSARAINDSPFLSDCLLLKGWMHYQLENYSEAEDLFRQSMRYADEEHQLYCWSELYLANLLSTQAESKSSEAESIYRRLRTLMRRTYLDKSYITSYANWIYVQATLGSCGDDESELLEAEKITRQTLEYVQGKSWPMCYGALKLHLARIQQRRGDTAGAIRLLKEGLELSPEPLATYLAVRNLMPTERSELEVALANLLSESGPDGLNEARRILEDGVKHREERLGPNHVQVALAQLRWGEFLARQSREEDQQVGARQIGDAYERLGNQSSSAVNAIRRRMASRLSDLHSALNQQNEAAHWRSTLEQLEPPHASDSIESDNADHAFRASAKPPPDQAGVS